MKKHISAFLLLLAVSVTTIFGCASTKETTSDSTKSEKTSTEMTPVTLNEVAHSIFYAPMYVAIEKGYFKDEGIALTLQTGFGADKTMTAVISGSADIGFMGSEASIYTYNEGANDYVVKPFYMGELLARIRVAKRLSKKEDEEIKKYQKDYLEVDFISRKVLIDQEEIHLTPIEFNLLKLLIEHRGKVLTHNYIQKEIWGYQDHSNQNALRVFMATLRRKIEKDTNHPHFIVTEVGVGYTFKD